MILNATSEPSELSESFSQSNSTDTTFRFQQPDPDFTLVNCIQCEDEAIDMLANVMWAPWLDCLTFDENVLGNKDDF